ncbi:MAG: uridine kinase [Bryobacter sp.]|nr:uridine kinase [Bryobacter sp.]
MKQSVLIGIGGASCSGKSCLAKALLEQIGPGASIFALDHYYADRSHIPEPARSEFNFDQPEALEASLIAQHLAALKQGQAIEQPRYDFATHSRLAGTETFPPANYVLVEGLFALYWPEVRALLDLAVYMETPQEECRARRFTRDVEERGRTPESIAKQIAETVEPMAAAFIYPTRAFANLVLSGAALSQANASLVLRRLVQPSSL